MNGRERSIHFRLPTPDSAYTQPPCLNPASCILSSGSRLRFCLAQLSPSFANRPPGFTNRRWKRANDVLSIIYGSAKGVKGQYR